VAEPMNPNVPTISGAFAVPEKVIEPEAEPSRMSPPVAEPIVVNVPDASP
jgi:hypothetical protein